LQFGFFGLWRCLYRIYRDVAAAVRS